MKLLENIDLIKTAEYATMYRIRQLILNIYNPEAFPKVDIVMLIRGTDEKHFALFQEILELTKSEYGFMVVLDVASEILEYERG